MKVLYNPNTPINIYNAVHHSRAPTVRSLSCRNFIKLQSEPNGQERSKETSSTARSGFVMLPQRKLHSRLCALPLDCVHKESTAERCTENPAGGLKNDDSIILLDEEQLIHTLSKHLTDHRLQFCIGRNREILLIKVSSDVQILNKFRAA